MESETFQPPPLQLTWPFGDWCIYCGKDAETFEDARREAMLDAIAEREDQNESWREFLNEEDNQE